MKDVNSTGPITTVGLVVNPSRQDAIDAASAVKAWANGRRITVVEDDLASADLEIGRAHV